jgi:hypothetical protein
MAQNSENIVIGASGQIFTGPASDDLTLPTDVETDLDSELVEVGTVSDDGVTFTDSRTSEDINSWSSFYPVKSITTGKTGSLEFVCREWNPESVALAFGGGEIDETAGVATYVPAPPQVQDYRALVVQWEDDGGIFRLVSPRGRVSGDVSTNLVRTGPADLPISYQINPAGIPVEDELETNPWYLLTDHPAFATGS